MKRKCGKCQTVKSLDSFPRNKLKHLGRGHYCKICAKLVIRNNYRTKQGLANSIYKGQLSSSRYRQYPKPNYTIKQFKEWLYSQDAFEKLYTEWVNSDYHKDKKPSVDRLNDYLSYTFDNIQLITWKENQNKLNLDKKIGNNNKQSKAILQFNLDGCLIKEFYSIAQASRELNINTKNITYCCQKKPKYNTAKGFIFKYKNEVEK